jgi:hypothetical protein
MIYRSSLGVNRPRGHREIVFISLEIVCGYLEMTFGYLEIVYGDLDMPCGYLEASRNHIQG